MSAFNQMGKCNSRNGNESHVLHVAAFADAAIATCIQMGKGKVREDEMKTRDERCSAY